MVAVGCSNDDADKDNDNKTEQPNENEGGSEDNIPENIFFGLDKESVTISPDGGSVDVVVYSNYKWEISGTSDWCTPSVKKGDANEDGQKVTFSADVTYDDREATFWFRCADEKIKLVVSQKLKAVIIPDVNNSFNIPAEGGVAVISYQTSVDCKVIIPAEAKDWITIAPATRGLVSENINLDIAENTTYSARTAVIKVVAKDNAELAVEYTINQVQNDAILVDENNVFTVPCAGGEVVIQYQTNIDCDVVIPEEAQDWITIVPETRGLVAQSATLHIAENTTYDSRSAVIKVVAKDNAELVVEYTINQVQNDAILADENNTFTLPSEGGSVVIDYQTNVDCEIIVPTNAQSWITILPETRGLVTQSATLHIAENMTYSSRSAVIKVVAKNNAELVVEYTINQEQNNAILADENNVFTVPGPGGEVVIKYQTNVDCEVIIPEEAQDWITIVPATRGLVAYNTTLNIAANYSGELRSSVIKIVSQEDNELFAEYTITQNMMYYLCYTSSNGKVVEPYSSTAFGATILSNTYKDGVGIIEFNAPITEIGEEAFYGCSSLTSVTIGDGVTTIGDKAFYYCSSLTSVTIPDSVTTVGNYAFYECNKLTSVTIPDSVTTIGSGAFWGCSSLTSVTIPDSVTTVGHYAFYECNKLTSITIPDSVTAIGVYAFYRCSSLTSVTIGDSVTTIGYGAFCGCSSLISVTIPDSVTTIEANAFKDCINLTSVTIGDSVTTIGGYAFGGCENINTVNISDITAWCNIDFIDGDTSASTNVTANPLYAGCSLYLNGEIVKDLVLPSDITEIKTMAFRGCSSLTSVTIPDSVTTIGDSAFSGCESLTSVTIPDSVTTIGEWAFCNCRSLTSVTIPDNVTSIGEHAFGWCGSLTSVTIPDSVTTIGDSAFSGCESLTSVTIPNSVTTIGHRTFEGCSSLTSITIPDSVTKIGSYALHNCSSLTSVTIPDSVTKIGEWAFGGCSSLTSVYCKAVTPPAGDSWMFGSNASARKIYVPTESVGAYKSAEGWSSYKSYIVGYDF